MKTIELINTCFGPDVCIDGESLFLDEFDPRSEEYIIQLKLRLISELIKNVNNLSIYDCESIANIIITNNNNWD
jgi:hypothetical protein